MNPEKAISSTVTQSARSAAAAANAAAVAAANAPTSSFAVWGNALTPLAASSPKPGTLDALLFSEGYAFDFFQAVRVLEVLNPKRIAVGRAGPPNNEAVRFRCHISLNFPPSSIYDIEVPTDAKPVPLMTVAFFGLTGPSGMLPRHYTDLLIRLDRDGRGAEKHALRDWIDLFNHRFISHFYRAWEKYRFFIPYQRHDFNRPEPDPFTLGLYSLCGLGFLGLRGRQRIGVWEVHDEQPVEKVLTRVDDLALLYYSGFLSHRPRNAVSLEAMLRDFFTLPVSIRQFHGQWLRLDEENQTRLGMLDGNCGLGVNAVAGERVWDVQSKIRIRVGPLNSVQFNEFLPDRAVSAKRKAFFLLSHLVRLYAGAEIDFDVQLVLRSEDVPECQLSEGALGGPRLGWNTWALAQAFPTDADDAVFEGEEVRWLNKPSDVLAAAGLA